MSDSQIAVLRDLLQKGRDNTDALLKIFQELGEQAVLQKVYALEIKKMDAALTATAEAAEKWEREVRADEREKVRALLSSKEYDAPVGNSVWGEGFQEGHSDCRTKLIDAIRQMKEKV